MVDVVTNIEINAPLKKVMDYACNPDTAMAWYENIKSVVWKTAGPLRVGTHITFGARFLLKELSYTYEVTEFSDHTFVMKTAEGPFPMETIYRFEMVSANVTTMTLQNKGEPTGFSKLFTPLISAMMKRANQKDLKRLKNIIEQTLEQEPE